MNLLVSVAAASRCSLGTQVCPTPSLGSLNRVVWQGTRGATCSQLSGGVPGYPLTNSSFDKVQGKSGLHIYCLVAPRDSDVPHHLQPGANSLGIRVLASC